MLLKSASTPFLNSNLIASSPEQPKSSINLITTSYSCNSNGGNTTIQNLIRATSDSDLRRLTYIPPKKPSFGSPTGPGLDSGSGPESRLLTNSGLGLRERVVVEEDEEEEQGFDSFDGGNRGGRSDGGGLFGDCNYNNNNNNGTDVYYKMMIEANPGNSLLLGNYAKFLKEVRGDYVKAEEYCGRAILANPGDPNVLALYADLIWRSQRDSSRAVAYFEQAVQAAPDDCYVLGSYAHFLWDADDEDEEDDMNVSSNLATPAYLSNVTASPYLVAAS